MPDNVTTRILLISAMAGAFIALARILQSPPDKRPKGWQWVGRLILSGFAGYLMGAGLNHWLNLEPHLVWGFAGVAGFFGDVLFFFLLRAAEKWQGISLTKEERDGH